MNTELQENYNNNNNNNNKQITNIKYNNKKN